MDKKYEITATATGGREGTVKTSDNAFNQKLSFPKELGGSGSYLNPEQLFASGYAGCFSQATIAVANENKISKSLPVIKVTVQLYIDSATGFHIKVGVNGIFDDTWPEKEANEFMIKSHHTCPYSKLIKKENFLHLQANDKNINI